MVTRRRPASPQALPYWADCRERTEQMRIFRAVCHAVAASGAAALIGAVPAGAATPAPNVTTVDSLATVSCTASVTVLERYEETFLARVTVTNTGNTTIRSWRTT